MSLPPNRLAIALGAAAGLAAGPAMALRALRHLAKLGVSTGQAIRALEGVAT